MALWSSAPGPGNENKPLNLSIVQGKVSGHTMVQKVGVNADVDAGTLPEDVWDGGGLYTGFQPTVAQTVTIVSSSALDTALGTGARSVRLLGLDANYMEISETVSLNGLLPVVSTAQFLRVHSASVQAAGSLGVNQGTLAIRQTLTPLNVFLQMTIGRNQTNSSGYTVPAGKTGYLIKMHSSIRAGAANVGVDGYLWIRNFNMVFRARRPFKVNSNFILDLEIVGGLVLTEKTDIIIRLNFASASNIDIVAGYDLILVDNGIP